MNKFIKIGLIGLSITAVISIFLSLMGSDPAFSAPFLMPWVVFLLIGVGQKRKGS